MKNQCTKTEWLWHPAPTKTEWGEDMVVADVAIDKDHTVSIYCEKDQIKKVEAVFSTYQQEPCEYCKRGLTAGVCTCT